MEIALSKKGDTLTYPTQSEKIEWFFVRKGRGGRASAVTFSTIDFSSALKLHSNIDNRNLSKQKILSWPEIVLYTRGPSCFTKKLFSFQSSELTYSISQPHFLLKKTFLHNENGTDIRRTWRFYLDNRFFQQLFIKNIQTDLFSKQNKF